MVLLASLAVAHGTRFGVSALSVAPGGTDAIWGVANGWGLVHTRDGGESWEWTCEEALGTSSVYDVEALGAEEALVASEAGLLRVGPGCGVAFVPGLPTDGYPAFIVAAEGGWWVSAYTDAWDGLWWCDTSGCVEGPLGGADVYVKSVVVDGARVWATTVQAESLAGALWRVDGEVPTQVAAWPDGSVDPRVLVAQGDHLLVWLQGRDSRRAPGLVVSEDGGATFVDSLAVGVSTDPVPAVLDAGDGHTYYLGTDSGRTFFSSDGGYTFLELSEALPAIRCSAVRGDGRVFCADHYADGYDIGTWSFGRPFLGTGCLDDATPPDCTDACEAYVVPFQESGLYGGDACYPVLVEAESGCGSGAAGAAGIGAGLTARLLVGRRRSAPRAGGRQSPVASE